MNILPTGSVGHRFSHVGRECDTLVRESHHCLVEVLRRAERQSSVITQKMKMSPSRASLIALPSPGR